MKTIPLTQGKVAIVDDEDYEELSQYRWYYNRGYAVRQVRVSDSKWRMATMGRLLLKIPKGMMTSYRSLDKLDNRRSNLRVASYSECACNRRPNTHSKTGLKGVRFHRRAGKWEAQIGVAGKIKSLGLHTTPKLAHAAYCEASAKYHGEFGRVK